MNTVNINGCNVYQKYGMILTSKVIPPAAPKVITIDIPGTDGILDITESMGIVRYNNRTIQLNFAIIGNSEKNYSLYEKISNEFNGSKVNVILSESPKYYYEGRCTNMTFEQEKGIASISIEVDCLPYAKTVNEYIVTASGNATVDIVGSRMPVVPEITVEGGETDISFGGKSYHLTEGEYALQNYIIMNGTNTFTISGTATVTWKYRKGKL